MAASGARVIDLEEFRRRRAAREERESSTAMRAYAALCVWYPVWYWVPVVTGV